MQNASYVVIGFTSMPVTSTMMAAPEVLAAASSPTPTLKIAAAISDHSVPPRITSQAIITIQCRIQPVCRRVRQAVRKWHRYATGAGRSAGPWQYTA
jgi:hypothetical protein